MLLQFIETSISEALFLISLRVIISLYQNLIYPEYKLIKGHKSFSKQYTLHGILQKIYDRFGFNVPLAYSVPPLKLSLRNKPKYIRGTNSRLWRFGSAIK
jgi:hypothetical protein